jgi:sucrose-6-phosphate hydrolase SacC (GH32 family)
VARVGERNWLDLVARYDGRKLMLFVDGVPLDEREATGTLRTGNREPIAIGAATSGGFVDRPIRGRIDHAGLWNRALSDAEIVAISGGSEFASRRRAEFAAYVQSPPVASAQLLVNQSRELKARFQSDPHRPRFHFLIPEEGDAMPADPNGAVYHEGRYHLFYIFQRHQSTEPRVVHCWGHASSIDLLHWEHHPTALDVAPNDPDRGIFSGNLFFDAAGTPTILYHGVSIGNAIATSTDSRLLTWTKSPRNPIVPIPRQGDPDFGKYESWDPHGWYDADSKTYFAIFGGMKPTLFRGPEITQLKYVGPFLPNDTWSGPDEDVSCPDFFPFGDEHMLLCISHYKGARYFLGPWRDGVYSPRTHGRMNWPGGAFFAPETLIDGQGRRILWAWVLDPRDASVRVAQGWSGVMSAPRVLSPDGAGGVRIEPVEELKRLRIGEGVSLGETPIPQNASVSATGVGGDCLDIEAVLIPSAAGDVGIQVRCSPDLKERTTIAYNAARKTLRIDFQHSSLDDSIEYRSYVITPPHDPALARTLYTVQEAPLELAPNEPLRLRILLDRSILEVFANGRQCVTQRIFPTRPDSLGVNLFAAEQTATLVSLRAWSMAASNAD